jgi:hypothetical protein
MDKINNLIEENKEILNKFNELSSKENFVQKQLE